MKKAIIIIDGYRVSSSFVQKIKKRGYDNCFHIQSSIEKPKKTYSFDPSLYKKLFVYNNNFDELLRKLKKYSIHCIIAGCESGVDLAEMLVENLNISSQKTKYIGAHTNKYKMIELLRKKNIPTIDTILANNKEEIFNWIKDKKWPIILKPPKSYATFLVQFCFSKKDIEKAFEKILHTKLFSGIKSKQVVAQTCLKGTEYVLNSVSYNHQHFFSDFWVYNKIHVYDHTYVYDYIKLLPYQFPQKKKLCNYILKALDALDIKQGPAHSEIFFTKKGPILMEMGARIMGAIPPDPIDLAIGRNQLDLSIDSYLKPQKFLKEAKKAYKRKKHLLIKFLISSYEGKIKSIQHLEKINSLPSLYKININAKKGSHLKKTKDLFSSPGKIILLHENEETLMKDYKTIRKLEKTMFQIT